VGRSVGGEGFGRGTPKLPGCPSSCPTYTYAPTHIRNAPRRSRGAFLLRCRRWPTLPRSLDRSTIGAVGLNDRVRDGNGCGPYALIASETTAVLRCYGATVLRCYGATVLRCYGATVSRRIGVKRVIGARASNWCRGANDRPTDEPTKPSLDNLTAERW
jgi:hypothetical protein